VKDGFRQSMAWLHTWTGLVLGWLLYFIFVTGTLGYLDTEIDRWMQPELPPAADNMTPTRAVTLGHDWLQANVASAKEWNILVPSDRNIPQLRLYWRDTDNERDSVNLDAAGEPVAARDTGGGQRLYRMHWQLHYLPGWFTGWLISIATFVMFVAMVTGVITHKKIFKDFFTFRPYKGQRSWLDAHNALSVLSLPFQLMITYSGLVFMMFLCMPLLISAFYGGGEAAEESFFDEVFLEEPEVTPSGEPAALVDLAPLIAQAEARWGAGRISHVGIKQPGDANARVHVNGLYSAGPLRTSPGMTFDGVTGELLHERAASGTVARNTRDVFLGLHEGMFAGPLLRFFYLLSSVMGTAMIATGLILWTVKRRQKLDSKGEGAALGVALVERLNVGTVVGLNIAVAVYFLANRLIPADFEGRADWEVHAMFLAWAAMLIHAGLRSPAQGWREQCVIAAVAFCAVPVVNALTTERHLVHSLAMGDWVFAGFDLAMIATGLTAAAVAFYLRGKPAEQPAGSRRAANRRRDASVSARP